MTANPNPRERLDAMVREKMGGVSHSHPTTPFKLAGALGHVALDLLQERDALKDKLAESEAKVKELEAKLADKEQHLSRAYDELRDHRDPIGAYTRRQIAAGKTCHTCVHFISRCESPNSDRVNCKIAEGWPHWTGCCKHEAIPEEARKKGAEHGE